MSAWIETSCGGCGAELGAYSKPRAGTPLFVNHIPFCPVYAPEHHHVYELDVAPLIWRCVICRQPRTDQSMPMTEQSARDTPTR